MGDKVQCKQWIPEVSLRMQSTLYPVFYCYFLERLGLALSESTQGGLCFGGHV